MTGNIFPHLWYVTWHIMFPLPRLWRVATTRYFYSFRWEPTTFYKSRIVVQNRCLVRLRSGDNKNHSIFIPIRPFTASLCPVNGSTVILAVIVPIMAKEKLVTQNSFGLICRGASLWHKNVGARGSRFCYFISSVQVILCLDPSNGFKRWLNSVKIGDKFIISFRGKRWGSIS